LPVELDAPLIAGARREFLGERGLIGAQSGEALVQMRLMLGTPLGGGRRGGGR
jgi:hypothetical protein